MGRFAFAVVVVLLLAATAALAEDRTVGWDSGQCEVFDFNETEGHFIKLDMPRDWNRSFTQSLMFFGKTYGDVGDLRATAVVVGPQTDKTVQVMDNPDALVIYTRKQFRIADYVSAEGGWVDIPLDPAELTSDCFAGVFTYSNEDRGLMIGLSGSEGAQSHSSDLKPIALTSSRDEIEFRNDGREWMIRLTVRPTLEVHSTATSADLSGSGFATYDDGSADGYITFQRYGPILRVSNPNKRKISKIWFYGYVTGDWFNTTREGAVYIMDTNYAFLQRTDLPYTRFTDQPAWGYISLDGQAVPSEFLVLLEPLSRPDAEFMLGYDNTAANQMSEFGSVGHAELGWPLDIPEDSTNWMIRVEFE